MLKSTVEQTPLTVPTNAIELSTNDLEGVTGAWGHGCGCGWDWDDCCEEDFCCEECFTFERRFSRRSKFFRHGGRFWN